MKSCFRLRNGLVNGRWTFEQNKAGRIVFLGGSITAMDGWRNHVMAYFNERFPLTTFSFTQAGIPSLGSVPHAFRLERDVLADGPVDLVFVEAAVNDATNMPDQPERMVRGMEGVVRHLRLAYPRADIVQLHFAMPEHLKDYRRGREPLAVAQHERVAEAYGTVSLNLALEVTERIRAGEFTWENDFQDLHPSPFGHGVYAGSIRRMLDAAFSSPPPMERPQAHAIPPVIDPHCYSRGRLVPIAAIRSQLGFAVEPCWRPADHVKTRAGFVDVPACVGTVPGAEFAFEAEGTAVGLLITSGPDAGRIEFSVDGEAWRTCETFTQWSPLLHLPWTVMLADELAEGFHAVRVRIAEGRHPESTGTALRVLHLLMN